MTTERDVCRWTQYSNAFWLAGCATRDANNLTWPHFEVREMAFCCYCGKRLEEVPYRESEDAED
jgi:hypothetical protein